MAVMTEAERGPTGLAPGIPDQDLTPTPARAEGFEQLYADEYEPMLRIAYLLVDSNEAAEEAVHDAFAKVYERWDRLANPGGYLRTCVVNRCRDVQRRAAIVLRFYDGLSEARIAEVLGVRPGTVKSLLSRGLAQLREAIEP